MVKYKQRIADRLLERKVLGKGAVLIEGPKWCGKTTTAKQLAKSVLDLGDASVLKQSTQMIEISPRSLLEGTTPRLIDEWQALPPIWDSIRSEVDRREIKGTGQNQGDRSLIFQNKSETCPFYVAVPL